MHRLLYLQDVRTDPEDYSVRALVNRMILQKVKHGARKGRSFGWAYTQEGIKIAPDVFSYAYDKDMVLRALFGEAAIGGASFRKYVYQREAHDGFVEAQAETTSGRIVESVLVYNTNDPLLQKRRRDSLVRLVRGEAVEDDYSVLSSL